MHFVGQAFLTEKRQTLFVFFDINKAQCVEKHPKFQNRWKSPVRKQAEFQNLQKSKIRNPAPGVHYECSVVPSVTS